MTDEEPTPQAQPRWGIPDALLTLLGATLLSTLTGGLWFAASGADEGSYGVAMAGLVGLWGGFVGLPFLIARAKGSGSLATDYGASFEANDVGIGVAAGVGSQFVLMPLLYIPLRLLLPDTFADPGENAEELFDRARGVGVVFMVLALTVGAPLVEELFFRGLLQRSLVRRLGPAVGIAVAAVVFGLTHYDPAALPGLVAFGVVLGVLAYRSGRLGPAVVAHIAFNTATVAIFLATR
ncbi:MAG TPA: CPBP family intramembrane glutamic endopeptidase [Acidimicrobiales bacterium]|nr:CPBP family intramembrane glutamic endopeptidase [Acidimicrobiales bacterium]